MVKHAHNEIRQKSVAKIAEESGEKPREKARARQNAQKF